jgi:hypothetical protein
MAMTRSDPNAPTGSPVGSAALDVGVSGLPFRFELSLDPLISFWTRSADHDGSCGAVSRLVGEEVRKAPELLGVIEDPAVLERHRDLLDTLMVAIFPPAFWEESFGAAMVPFRMRAFYATPAMQRLLLNEHGGLRGRVNLDAGMVTAMRRASVYAVVLRRLYGLDVELDYPIILTIDDPDTGLERHFRVLLDPQFIEVTARGPLPPLGDDLRRELRANLLDAARLEAVLPPDLFVFRGFGVFRAVDVTDQEVLSALKRDLIDRESIVSETRFLGLQDRLRTLFRRPQLQLGLGAIDGDRVLILNYGARHEHACIFADSAHHRASDFAGTVFERAVKTGRPVMVDDLTRLEGRTCIEEQIASTGARTFIVAPLHYQDKVIGTLDLGSPVAGDLDASQLPKLHEVLPLFSMAVQRSMDELNARIQTAIKERFTAIHPVVEWRFRKAVLDELERDADAAGAELHPIVFEQVQPLYALSDIRGSSTQRALAIQSDLLAQLRLARDVVEAAHAARRLPALDHLRYRIDQQLARLRDDVSAGDEVATVGFLRSEVEGLFEHLATFGEAVTRRLDAYRAALDPVRGTVYRQRRLFEDSVTRVTETISSYLDLEEEVAQSMVPHYFEKRNTDGVDHQIYVGGSLLEDGHFDPLYLKSLRLWQLMVVCGIAARADHLTRELPLPLQVSHLVLVQHTPLSIRFRADEKRFDVDGAYDMRYEIVKKRIDKALVKGTGERLTQPGRIAIVYSQPSEAAEYRGYLDYLHHLGYVAAEVEDLELDELQGVHGLRALRAAVTLREAPDRPVAVDVVRTAAR